MATVGDKIEIICSVETIRYYKDQWGIIQVSIDSIINGFPCVDKDGFIILKGNMPKVERGGIYHVVAEFVVDPKWGDEYNIIRIYSEIIFDENDKEGQKRFLSAIFNPRQVNSMYETLKNPYKVLDEGDAASLVKIRGVGMITAIDWISRFRANKYLGQIFSELSEYNLTNNMIERLMRRYESPEIIIEKVKENPYVLADEVDGIGWKRADEIAKAGGIKEDDPKRIGAYMIKYLRECGEDGRSKITTDELLGVILDDLGEDIPDANITEAVQGIKNRLWYSADKTEIGLKLYYNMEYKVAEELIRLRDACPLIDRNCWENTWLDSLRKLEEKQGWQFTEEQKNGIYLALDQNVVLITGMAGTGKSSLVTGILDILKDCDFVQCALSGRAASRLSEITGEKGYTIHRLLKYPNYSDEAKQGFSFHDENPLPFDIYILDEVSMVSTDLFYYLLRAIPSGAKLICLGDHGQLEAIGSGNIAHDMMVSPEIATIILTKIHRQAEASGIISEACKIRRGQQIVEKDWVGTDIRGELKDFKIETYSDLNNTYYKLMAAYSTAMAEPDFDLMQTQIIVPVKTKGSACTYELNNALQELINPASHKKKEVTLYSNGRPYILREGDKIINTSNNYGLNPVIYNGNIGKIIKIDVAQEIIVADFIGVGEVEIPDERNYWKGLELGYAITGHKSQGSQWEHIIVGMDFSGYALINREWLYTAITRAQKKCDLLAQVSALRFATSSEGISKKSTHLQTILHELSNPVLVF